MRKGCACLAVANPQVVCLTDHCVRNSEICCGWKSFSAQTPGAPYPVLLPRLRGYVIRLRLDDLRLETDVIVAYRQFSAALIVGEVAVLAKRRSQDHLASRFQTSLSQARHFVLVMLTCRCEVCYGVRRLWLTLL